MVASLQLVNNKLLRLYMLIRDSSAEAELEQSNQRVRSRPASTMAGLPLAAVAFHLCLLASSSSALRPATTASESGGGSRAGRTAYHFQPAKNWQNGER